MVGGLFKHKKTLAELEEDQEALEGEDKVVGTQLSIAQKRVAIAELKKRGLSAKHFDFSWSRIVEWLRTH